MQRSPAFYLRSAACTVWFRLHGIRCPAVGCEGRLPVLYRTGTIEIGQRLMVRGRVAPCEIGAADGACLRIGDRVFINQGASITATRSIEVGSDTMIGDFSAIYDSSYHDLDPGHPVTSRPVVIGTNVWLGRGTVVLPGSSIGDHTVVAAQSVVRGSLPPSVLAAGNPATVVRQLEVPVGWRRR